MHSRIYIYYCVLFTIFLLLLGISSCADSGKDPADIEITLPDSNLTYFEDILRLFRAKCASQSGCHDFNDQAAGLDLTDYTTIIRHPVYTDFGSEPLVISGNGAASFLYRILLDNEGGRPRMPLSGPPYLNQNNTDGVKTWIDEGLAVTKD
jgi:hypothetical protein